MFRFKVGAVALNYRDVLIGKADHDDLEPNRRHNRAPGAIREGNLADVGEKSASGNDSGLLAIQRNPNL